MKLGSQVDKVKRTLADVSIDTGRLDAFMRSLRPGNPRAQSNGRHRRRVYATHMSDGHSGPLCKTSNGSPTINSMVTTDEAQVTCRRCRGILGVTPASVARRIRKQRAAERMMQNG